MQAEAFGMAESPGLNIIGNLWVEFKRAVHARQPKNTAEPEVFCKEE